MKYLVFGGRDFSNKELLVRALNKIQKLEGEMTLLICGMARGADMLAFHYAKERNIAVDAKPADWNQYGKAAGFIRNQQMLTEGKPDIGVEFPGGRGTKHMHDLLVSAKIPIMVIKTKTPLT